MTSLTRYFEPGRRLGSVAAAIGVELHEGEDEGEEACGEAPHGKHEGEPAEVCVGPLSSGTAEDGEHQERGDRSREEDTKAGGEELAGVWLHRGRA